MMPSADKEKVKKTKIVVKTPTQERSRQTVATILDACAKLLISEGFYALTTDKIAKEAGVSIGSLYQFFGNKESVVQAVVKNLIEEDKRIVSDKMRAISPLPPEQRVRAMFAMGVEVVRRNSDLRSKLTTIQYYVAEANYMSESIRFFQDVLRYNLPQLPGRDMDKVAYVTINAFMGLVNTMFIDNQNSIHDQGVVDEMTQLFYPYLNSATTATNSTVTATKGDFI